MRRFELHRDVDATGVSGTGVVAEGNEFGDGRCTIRWRTDLASTVVYDSVADVQAIHGHGGLTRIVWLDRERSAWVARLSRDPDGEWRIHNDRGESIHLTNDELEDVIGQITRFAMAPSEAGS